MARERAATGTKIYKQVSSRPPQEDGNLIGNGFAKKLCIRHRAGIGSGIGTPAPTLETGFGSRFLQADPFPYFQRFSMDFQHREPIQYQNTRSSLKSIYSIFNWFPASGAHPISQ